MFNTKTKEFIFPEYVLSQEEFYNLIINSKIELHNYMVKNDKYIKVFICYKETEEDRNNIGYLKNCKVDEICDDYKNRYFVAELNILKTGFNLSISNMIWFGYHEVWSYCFDIYEMHNLDKQYKKLYIKDFYISKICMYNDFINIYNTIKSLNRDIIEEKQLNNLKTEIEKIYKKIPNTELKINL
jgi:hypothetical protein